MFYDEEVSRYLQHVQSSVHDLNVLPETHPFIAKKEGKYPMANLRVVNCSPDSTHAVVTPHMYGFRLYVLNARDERVSSWDAMAAPFPESEWYGGILRTMHWTDMVSNLGAYDRNYGAQTRHDTGYDVSVETERGPAGTVVTRVTVSNAMHLPEGSIEDAHVQELTIAERRTEKIITVTDNDSDMKPNEISPHSGLWETLKTVFELYQRTATFGCAQK